MTVMRRELREMLKWCLAQPGKFRSKDAEKHFNEHQTTVGQKLKSLERHEYLKREVVSQVIQYLTVINREAAEQAANTASVHEKQSRVRKPRIRHKTSRIGMVNSIWQFGQQSAQQ